MHIDDLINSLKKEPNYIDLSLPSGTLWAECNVGANVETECGKYFAYGLKNGYFYSQINDEMFSWKWYYDQEKVDWTNYIFDDGSIVPNLEQLQELIDNTTHEATQYGNVTGILLTSKKNGKTLFFPHGGLFANAEISISERGWRDVDAYSHIWTTYTMKYKKIPWVGFLGSENNCFCLLALPCEGLNIRTIKLKSDNLK
jgi:hypothetical protein